jgi:superfamily I DNA/RNA helicase
MNRLTSSSRELIAGTPQQQAIWDRLLHGTEHVLVEARTGAGKTFTIVQGVARLPETPHVGIFSFNVHNVKAVKAHLQNLGVRWVKAQTFHSFGFAAIRRAFPGVQVVDDKLRVIVRRYSRGDRDIQAAQVRLVQLCKNNMDDGHDLDRLYHLALRHSIKLPDLREEYVLQLVPTVLEECLERQGGVDFDDQIWMPVRQRLPVEQLELILIDEAQDANRAQQQLIQMACPTGRVVPVGDRYQSIYCFRGADDNAIPSIYEFLRNTKRGCIIMPLTVTQRCPRSHVRLVQGLVPDLEAKPNALEGEILEVEEDKALRMMRPRDLVVCRVNRLLVPIAYELIKRHIKVSIQGKDFGRGLPTLIDTLRGADIDDLLERLVAYQEREKCKLLALGEYAGPLIEKLEDETGCIVALCSGISEIVQLRDRIETIFADYEDDGRPRDFVLLGTIHRTKGLEANNVFVLGPNLIPHPRAKKAWEHEQERNLAYIAATRAKFGPGEPGRLIAGDCRNVLCPERLDTDGNGGRSSLENL